MGLSNILRAALPAAAAARTGYLAGEDTGRKEREATERLEYDRAEKRRLTAESLNRQSRLDRMKASVDETTIERNKAQADKYRRDDGVSSRPPKTLNTDQGIMQWDSATRSFKKTGLRSKTSGSDARREKIEDRADNRARAQGTQAALSGVNRQIDDTQGDMRSVSNDYTLDDEAIKTRTSGLKSRLDSLTRVGDSLNTEVQRQSRPASSSSGSVPPALKSALPSMTARTETAGAARADSAAALKKYHRLLELKAPERDAKAAYDADLKRIAQKHGKVR